jgi:Ca-activated chloride channel family protein
MTPFTSFVAVEETIVTDNGKPRRVDVPVEIPEGLSYEGVFGKDSEAAHVSHLRIAPMQYAVGIVGGVPGGRRAQTTAPPPPAVAGRPAISASKSEALADELREQPVKIDPGLLKLTGKVLVQVWLKDASDAVLKQLKAIGFEITAKPGPMKMVMGRIDVSKLKQLSELPGVKYVAPAPSAR